MFLNLLPTRFCRGLLPSNCASKKQLRKASFIKNIVSRVLYLAGSKIIEFHLPEN